MHRISQNIRWSSVVVNGIVRCHEVVSLNVEVGNHNCKSSKKRYKQESKWNKDSRNEGVMKSQGYKKSHKNGMGSLGGRDYQLGTRRGDTESHIFQPTAFLPPIFFITTFSTIAQTPIPTKNT